MIGAGGGGRIHGIEGRFVQFLRAIMASLPPLAISSVCRIFFLASISNVSFARGRVCGGGGEVPGVEIRAAVDRSTAVASDSMWVRAAGEGWGRAGGGFLLLEPWMSGGMILVVEYRDLQLWVCGFFTGTYLL